MHMSALSLHSCFGDARLPVAPLDRDDCVRSARRLPLEIVARLGIKATTERLQDTDPHAA